MLILSSTDVAEVITSAAATVDVDVSYMDCTDANPPVVQFPNNQQTPITTAATTPILAAPASGFKRNLKNVTIRNRHASLATDITVRRNRSAGTITEWYKTTLNAGETLEWNEALGFSPSETFKPVLFNYNTADQNIAAATTAYLTGTAITFPTVRPIAIGTRFRWVFSVTKTAAGTASNLFDVRFGTAGTTADTSRLQFGTGTGTNSVDTALIEILCIVRGPIGASCIVEGSMRGTHNLAATGFSTFGSFTGNVTSAAFDCTTANIIAGVSCTTAASTVLNFELVSTEVNGV